MAKSGYLEESAVTEQGTVVDSVLELKTGGKAGKESSSLPGTNAQIYTTEIGGVVFEGNIVRKLTRDFTPGQVNITSESGIQSTSCYR